MQTSAALHRTADDGNSWQSIELPGASPEHGVWWAGTLPNSNGYPSRRGALFITQSGQINPFTLDEAGAPGLRQRIGNAEGGLGVPVADLLPVRHPVFGDNFVVAATWNGLFMSTDAGATWTPAGLQGSVTFRLDAIEPAPGTEADIRVGYPLASRCCAARLSCH